ncbi:MAG: hypothetical protein ACCK38_01145 [Candidatus Karelsulcia muelleri]
MGKKLLNGLVLAIEPIVNKGKKYIKINKDGWTIDKKPSAHYEHNIAIINGNFIKRRKLFKIHLKIFLF